MSELGDYLRSRRALVSPGDVGLVSIGHRRVAGLRREEVALLAGMSVEYYVRLERGNAAGVSDVILDGISRALQLDDAEHAHLYDLVRAVNSGGPIARRRPVPRAQRVRPGTQRLLDAMTQVPAIIQNGRLDILASNALGRALFSEMQATAPGPVSFARFLFLDARSRSFYRDREDAAAQVVALLRAETGRVPGDHELSALIGDLSAGSGEFRALWETHDVRIHLEGVKRVRHPEVGDIDLAYEALQLTADRGLQLVAYTAMPGSPSDDALRLLGSLAASHAEGREPRR